MSEKLITVCTSSEYLPLSDMESWEENPRQISDDSAKRLDDSIKSLGLFKTFLVWKNPTKNKYQVIGGNQRYLRMINFEEQGYSFVTEDNKHKNMMPVTILSAEEAKIKLIALRDNNADGEWNYDELSHYLKSLDTLITDSKLDLDLALAGFDSDFLDDLIQYANDPEIKVMTASSIHPDEENEDGMLGDDEVSIDEQSEEPDEQKIVSVVLGHVRGRLRYETYQMLLETLSSCIEEELDEGDGGLDKAFYNMLTTYKSHVPK